MIAVNHPGRPDPPWQIAIEARLTLRSSSIAPGPSTTLKLESEFQVGNPNPFPIEFDAIVFSFRCLDPLRTGEPLAQRTTFPGEQRVHSAFYYSGSVEQVITGSGHASCERRLVTIPGQRAMTFRKLVIGPDRRPSEDPGPQHVTVYLVHNGLLIASPLSGQLPAWASLPQAGPFSSEVQRVRVCFEME